MSYEYDEIRKEYRKRVSDSAMYSGNDEFGLSRKKKKKRGFNIVPFIILLLILIIVGILAGKLVGKLKEKKAERESISVEESISVAESESASVEESIAESLAAENRLPIKVLLEKAKLMGSQYDYDGALELLNSDEKYLENEDVLLAISKYTAMKNACVAQDVTKITHIFFHTLVYDTSLAFDGDTKANGYNQVMTTVEEFKRICQQMYDKGYVLVSLHDIAHEEKNSEGKTVMVPSELYLPEGKQAFVMSQDDVCYYEYMKGDGMATRMIIGKDGRPTNEYIDKNGNVVVGPYDLVPVLDAFIDEHPDFSYHGHKAALCFTGYNGILGYRTDESYDPTSEHYDSSLADAPNDNIEADRATAIKVLKALVDDGYDLGSHSWGHRDMGEKSAAFIKTDSERWDRNVNSLIKEATGNACDIIIYPKGADIGDWRGYTSENGKAECTAKFDILYNLGFRYYCNVDSNQPWVQMGENYVRQGRINIDGDRMWRDMADSSTAKLTRFIDVKTVFDASRPTPVPGY